MSFGGGVTLYIFLLETRGQLVEKQKGYWKVTREYFIHLEMSSKKLKEGRNMNIRQKAENNNNNNGNMSKHV